VEIREINRRLRVDYASKVPVDLVEQPSELPPLTTAVKPVEPPVNQETLDRVLVTFKRTDTGNAERLVARFGRDLKYCHPWKKWLVWDHRRWKVDDTAAVDRMTKETVRFMYREAALLNDAEDAKSHANFAIASEKKDRRVAMMLLAKSEPGVSIQPHELNLHPWLFNCLNGTLDLRTGVLQPHCRDDLITQLCPVEYHPDAKCPLWDQTLNRFLAPDLIPYLQRLAGYALVGLVRDHVLPVIYGSGCNGKSTILGALLDTVGTDYGMKASHDLLMVRTHKPHPTELADLFGMRLVAAVETEEGKRLNETLAKELTGGDRVRARRMNEDFWEFKPTHKIFLATNSEPTVRGTNRGIWRRLKKIELTAFVDDTTADQSMPEKLRGELPGILAWCVRGCLDWQKLGLETPKSVIQTTQDYRKEQDILGMFLAEHAIIKNGHTVLCKDLYDAYKAWAEASNEYCMTNNMFGRKLRERGIVSDNRNPKSYRGIGLRDSRESKTHQITPF
jgi:putative DNA primase/helicase